MPEVSIEERFVELLKMSTRQAGSVAAHLQGKVRVESKSDEPTPESQAITAVDLATQDLILHQLAAYLPEISVDAEEDTALARTFRTAAPGIPLVVLDPVDGTYNYTRGSDQYAVMAGLIRDGFFRAVVIRYPTLSATYWALEGQGCFVQRDDAAPQPVVLQPGNNLEPDIILVSPRVDEARRAALRSLAREIQVCRCSAFDGACLALGIAGGSIAENRADRRRAIALYLNLQAGAVVTMGDRPWRGEDPDSVQSRCFPTICAPSESCARSILDTYRR